MLFCLWALGLLATGVTAALTSDTPCNARTATRRREWGSLSAVERTAYVNAVWCLRRQPATLPQADFPGVRDRMDDFVATHINYTTRIHNNGLLLPWHRHFLFLFETDLQQKCGYTGGVPYWDWSLYADDLSASPLLDGSSTSLSGNGDLVPQEAVFCTPNLGCLGRGTGGGCVQSGPFKDFEVHMGPFNPNLSLAYTPLPNDAFAYKPRCLSRNFNTNFTSRWNTKHTVKSLLAAKNIVEFLRIMEPTPPDSMGAHGGGHQGIGGDMGDLFSSPQDPIFMLHHSMVDRVWTLWQNEDPVHRQDALNGTTIINNPPGSPTVTVDTVVEFGVLDRPRRVKQLMQSMDDDYCYVYA
ncbi:hypothetical protein FE257_002484 [Aspergillus nanangensis]|uniref:Tyrosinase copper-binding domain-containing protein n=1 Tax=Aspergillus nanangensis TaxID=2582783 RepID=A0AAD4GXZ1_ASPNN|nr:hypothetical protein FE257_002484 [Aspergillus nanangensis]